MAAGAIGFFILAGLPPASGVFPVVLAVSIIAGGVGLSFPVLLLLAQNSVQREVMGVATSLVQLSRSLGGTLGVTVLGAYLAIHLADLVGGAVRSDELTNLVRPEVLAAMAPSQVALLRAEMADALRGVFAVGAVSMAIATALSLRLEEIKVAPRRGFGRMRNAELQSAE
jgi:hypothetical protein